MEWYQTGAMMLGLLIGLMAIGMPVAFAFIGANLLSIFIVAGGWASVIQVIDNSTSLITSFSLVAVPMFILMGSLFFHTGLANRVFDCLDVCFGRLRARLSYLTVAGGAVYSTLIGSSMANTAMLGSLLVPEMEKRGYKRYMAMGPILGTGGLAMIIPPSSLAVLLGSLAQIDIGALLIAGLVPGFILAVLYALAIFILATVDKEAAPTYDVPPVPLSTKLWSVTVNILPMGFVVFSVVGFIILGITTPSEAAVFGVASVLILAAVFRSLTIKAILASMESALKVAGMAFLIIVGSTTFSQVLSYSGASAGMIEWATSIGASPYVMLAIMFAILVVLGMFMDAVSMMMLTIPIFFPLAKAFDFDLVWFGIIFLMALEMSLTTPPFGMLLYIMLGIAPKGTTLGQVSFAAAPYLFCDLILVILLIAFPALALFLPGLM